MKKGTQIKMPATRFEKIHKRQELNGIVYEDKRLVPISSEQILVYEGTKEGRVVFCMCDGLRVFIDETLFNIKNYIVL